MSPTPNTLDHELTAYRAGDRVALDRVFRQVHDALCRRAQRLAPDLPADIGEEIANEVFVLLLEKPDRFDPARGSAHAFLFANLLPEAVRRIRANNTVTGNPKRRRGKNSKVTVPAVSMDDLPEVASAGYGSPEAIEAACDAHAIWSRAASPMRLIIGGLADGKKQEEIAAEIGTNRFHVSRMVKALQREFAAVA